MLNQSIQSFLLYTYDDKQLKNDNAVVLVRRFAEPSIAKNKEFEPRAFEIVYFDLPSLSEI